MARACRAPTITHVADERNSLGDLAANQSRADEVIEISGFCARYLLHLLTTAIGTLSPSTAAQHRVPFLRVNRKCEVRGSPGPEQVGRPTEFFERPSWSINCATGAERKFAAK